MATLPSCGFELLALSLKPASRSTMSARPTKRHVGLRVETQPDANKEAARPADSNNAPFGKLHCCRAHIRPRRSHRRRTTRDSRPGGSLWKRRSALARVQWVSRSAQQRYLRLSTLAQVHSRLNFAPMLRISIPCERIANPLHELLPHRPPHPGTCTLCATAGQRNKRCKLQTRFQYLRSTRLVARKQ